MNILEKLSKIPKSNPQTLPYMSDQEFALCKARLSGRGMNLFPNKFDRDIPYFVGITWEQPIFEKGAHSRHNFGTFKCLETATAVAKLVGLAFIGKRAITGDYDLAVVEASPEWHRWCNSKLNQTIIKMAMEELPTAVEVHRYPDKAYLLDLDRDTLPHGQMEVEFNPFA